MISLAVSLQCDGHDTSRQLAPMRIASCGKNNYISLLLLICVLLVAAILTNCQPF